MTAGTPDSRISIKQFVLLSLAGPITGLLICLLVSGWRGSTAFGFVVGGGHFLTHVSIYKTIHKILITKLSRLSDSTITDLRRGFFSDRQELFLHRSHYVTILSLLAAITAGALGRSYAGLLYGFVAVVVAHLVGNRVIKSAYGPDIAAALRGYSANGKKVDARLISNLVIGSLWWTRLPESRRMQAS